jgi:hypothetical protein
MAKTDIPTEKICDLSMIKADYRYVIPNGTAAFFGYRIKISRNQEGKAQFDVPQENADQFATELVALAALIRAHAIQRK